LSGWIGVDFDGTLAYYDGWKGEDVLGEPVMVMLERVRGWIASGVEVRIVTARADGGAQQRRVEDWTNKHLGQKLRVTREKDFQMRELWDDRAVQVIPNTGQRVDGLHD
jgi:hypothetical protein